MSKKSPKKLHRNGKKNVKKVYLVTRLVRRVVCGILGLDVKGSTTKCSIFIRLLGLLQEGYVSTIDPILQHLNMLHFWKLPLFLDNLMKDLVSGAT